MDETAWAILADRAAIRDIVEGWAVWRDSGQWDKLMTVWHDDAMMSTTWQQRSGAAFVEASRAAWARGVDVQHMLGGTAIEVAGTRAVAETKTVIQQRGNVHDVLVDVRCTGRFYDFLERRDGRWGIVWRQPTYEHDRMDPVEPGATLALDPELLGSFPDGYRHLAYLQTVAGMDVKRDMPVGWGRKSKLCTPGGAAGSPAVQVIPPTRTMRLDLDLVTPARARTMRMLC